MYVCDGGMTYQPANWLHISAKCNIPARDQPPLWINTSVNRHWLNSLRSTLDVKGNSSFHIATTILPPLILLSYLVRRICSYFVFCDKCTFLPPLMFAVTSVFLVCPFLFLHHLSCTLLLFMPVLVQSKIFFIHLEVSWIIHTDKFQTRLEKYFSMKYEDWQYGN